MEWTSIVMVEHWNAVRAVAIYSCDITHKYTSLSFFDCCLLILSHFLCIVLSFVRTGYRKYYNGLREYLLSQSSLAHRRVELVPLEDARVTGNFEVTVLGTGQILHSKRQVGQGRAQTEAERRAILEQILELLDDMESE
jgi:hypothetical protein